MKTLSMPALRSGGPNHLPHSTILQAGPLSALFEQGELRRITLGNGEVIRRIYATLRGPGWETIPSTITDLKIESKSDNFSISYNLIYKQAEFDFVYIVTINGNSEGKICFDLNGKAGQDFKTNRVGLCVLHPLQECMGKRVKWTGQDKVEREGFFPTTIEPHQPFFDIANFKNELEQGLWAELNYAGEVFEMEDQRNWSDGSFKTYSPPQAEKKPRSIAAGWEMHHSVSLSLNDNRSEGGEGLESGEGEDKKGEVRKGGDSTAIILSKASIPDLGKPIPQWGFGLPSHGIASQKSDREKILRLNPKHLRANIRFSQSNWKADFLHALSEAQAYSLPLEISLLLTKNDLAGLNDSAILPALSDLKSLFQSQSVSIIRWLIFSESDDSIPLEKCTQIKKQIQALDIDSKASFALGSKSDFVLLNRNRIELSKDSNWEIATSVSPQVHLTDNRTMTEGLQGFEGILKTNQALWPNQNLNMTSISMKRSPLIMALKNPAIPFGPDIWKKQIDTRQFSLFGAAWTLGVLQRLALAESKISATFFETTGLLGLMTGINLGDENLQVPNSDLQLSENWTFPLYQVFADWAEFQKGRAYSIQSTSPLKCDGILLEKTNEINPSRTLLICNLEGQNLSIRLDGFGSIKKVRRLNEKNAMESMLDPLGFRAQEHSLSEDNSQKKSDKAIPNSYTIQMLPYEYIRLDLGE